MDEILNENVNESDDKKYGGMIDKYNVNNDTKFHKDSITSCKDIKGYVPKSFKIAPKLISKNGNIYN